MAKMDDAGSGKQVIARAAAVLRALENQSSGRSLAEIAAASGLPRSTVHRIVAALEAQQLVMTAPGGVRLGPAVVRMAASAHTDVVMIARPFVESLGRRTRETVDVTVLRGAHAVSIDQYSSDQELRVISAVGTAFPLHCTAHGKALLAELGDHQATELVRGTMARRTPATITKVPDLLQQLAQARRTIVATDAEEHAQGVCGLGVVIQTGQAELYAISLAIPQLRFKDSQDAFRSALLQCKAEIETNMKTGGGNPLSSVSMKASGRAS